MAGRSARGWGVLAVLAVACAVKVGCAVDGAGVEEVPPEVRAVLRDTWPAVVAPTLARVEDAVVALEDAARAWDAAGGEDGAARAEAQAAWRAAMSAWQEAELLQVGPAGSALTVTAGRDLRERIYAWPAVNRCRVDQETLAGGWDAPGFAESSVVTVLGLHAMEVLFFSPAGENGCPAQVDVNASGDWDARGVAGIQAARAAYARALAVGLRADVDALRAAWSPESGDFAGSFAAAGEDGSPYASAQDAVNAVFDALFYLEEVTKDRKLGYALGNGDCTGGSDTCLGAVETPLAGGSHTWVAANLRGFRTLFTGGPDGQGLEELLRAAGDDAVADAMLVALDAADAAAAALAAPLEVAVAEDRASVEALQLRVDAVCDLLRVDVAAVLSLQVPLEAAGDHD